VNETDKLQGRARLRAGAAPLVLSLAIISGPARAQEPAAAAPAAQAPAPAPAPAPLTAEEQPMIIVTGTRIARPDLEASSPVTVVTAQSLQVSGTNTVENFLRTIPQAAPAIGGNTNNGNPGVATVDLRNLGEERTLVLVDGKRFVPYDSDGVVDLNMIPASLIDRVEVLTGGASSVYGSDAIAGVVNFIMKKDFEGIEADAQLGITQRGDGFDRSFSLTMGVNSGDGRGNLVGNVTYVKRNPVTQGARKFSRDVLASADLGPGGRSATNAFGTVDGLVSPVCAPQEGTCVFDENRNLVPYDDRFGFNFNPYNLLQTPQEKWTATVLGRYDITDSIEFFGRASFANSRVTTIIAPSGTFFFPFDIDYATNPFLTAQARSVLAANDVAGIDPNPGDGIVTVAFGRRTVELGTRNSIYENTAYQFVGGLRGDIFEGLKWEAFAQWGRTSRTQTFANDISFSRTQAGILNGTVNLFGAGGLTPDMGQLIRLDLQEHDARSQVVAGGFLSYDLPFALGGTKNGAIVVGGEYRKERTKQNPDENLIQGNAPGFGSSTPIDAQIQIKEAYAEAKIPIFNIASIEAGVRYSDYKNRDNLTGQSHSFKNTSYKFGGDLEPIPGFRLRAMYQRAVRAPNLTELGQPRTPSTGDLTADPCQSSLLSPAAYAAGGPLAQLCLATGVPAGAAAAGIVGGPVAGQVNNYLGGNIDLTPEKSRTITAGIVVQPDFLRGFTASVDYFDIRVKNAITQLPEEEIVNLCYNVEMDPTGTFCSRIFRNPLNGSLRGGTETGVDARVINAGFLRAEGIDIKAAYQFKLNDDMKLTFDINATRILKSWIRSTPVSPILKCEGLAGKTCLRPQPKWEFIQTSTLDWGPATIQLRWRYIGKITNDLVGFGDASPSDFAVPTIGARSYFDLFTSYDVTDNFKFRFGVNNLFDKQPPIVGNDYGGTTENSGNTYPATYDTLGRSFFVGANVKF
jgi:iron complex outermembrane recepter protein